MVAMAACLLAAAGTACHSVSHQPEVIAGVESPSERIANLKKLAEEVKKMDPAQKGQVAMDLTGRSRRRRTRCCGQRSFGPWRSVDVRGPTGC